MTIPLFFRIPRELRDRIYHFTLLNQRVQINIANLVLDIHYIEEHNNLDPYEEYYLRWLFASRQVLSEGLDQFYTHAKLQNYSIRHNRYTDHLMLDIDTSTFDLRRVKAAELSLQMGKEYCERDGKDYDLIVPRGKEKWEGTDEDFAELGKVIKSMDHCAFENLKLTVYLFRTYNQTKRYGDTGNRYVVNLGAGSDADDNVGSRDDDEHEHENLDSEDDSDDDSDDDSYSEYYWNAYGTNLTGPDDLHGYLIDFNFLKNLGTQWKRIQIEYIPTYMLAYWGDEDPVAANIIAVPIIQEGLAGIAKALVGGKGWVVRDSLQVVESSSSRWLLDVDQRPDDERVQELNYIGLRSYLGECEGCGNREEIFNLQPDREDETICFMGEECGQVVTIETPVLGGEM